MTIDASHAPAARADIASARLGDSVLLYEPSDRRLHTLNTSAALVWRRIDGKNTLRDIASSLVELFAADRAVIESDVLAVIERFTELGLLAEPGDRPFDHLPAPAAVDPAEAQLRGQLDAREWRSQTGPYQAVGLSFSVRSEDPDVTEELARSLHSLRVSGDHADHAYSVRHRVHEGVAQWRVYFDGKPLGTVVSADAAVSLVLWHLNQATIEHTAGVLFFHAGAVQLGARVVMMPAEMDSGKSTLTTALVQRGMSYVTDEAVALDVAMGRALPYPKAICLDAGSHALFPQLVPQLQAPFDASSQARWHVDPYAIAGATVGGGGRISLVVSPRYSAGASTTLERVDGVDAVRLLLENTFPFETLGARGFHALVGLADSAPVYRLGYSNLDEACNIVVTLARDLR